MKYAKLTRSEGYEKITHIIWPETAMTYAFASGDYWAKELASLVPENGLLFTGVVRAEGGVASKDALRIYNSVQAVDHEAVVRFVYDKNKLVPFGEFVPFRGILPVEKITHGQLDFTPGPGAIAWSDMPERLPEVAPLICYEAIFPGYSDHTKPDWLLNITNDAWFGISTGPYQHLQMSRARAVEQGVPLLRAANTGISAYVDAYGRVLKMLPLGVTGVLDNKLPKDSQYPTIYIRFSTLIHWSGILLMGVYVMMLSRKTGDTN
jgi:apolipoprotein N-acyltransferase